MTFFLLQIIRKILLELIGKVIKFMCHFMNALYVLTNFVFFCWIIEILDSSFRDYFSALKLFTFNIRIIQIRVILFLGFLLFEFGFYWRVIFWFNCWIRFLWSFVFGLVHFWKIQRVVGWSVHFRCDRYLTILTSDLPHWVISTFNGLLVMNLHIDFGVFNRTFL